jgi:hypothetical protein
MTETIVCSNFGSIMDEQHCYQKPLFRGVAVGKVVILIVLISLVATHDRGCICMHSQTLSPDHTSTAEVPMGLS